MFKVGDLVRLKNGRTPMVVLFEDSMLVYAKYANYSHDPVIKQDYKNYPRSASYIRSVENFVRWDGDNKYIYREEPPMPRRYRLIAQSHISGSLLNYASNGDMVLELKGNLIASFKPEDLEEDIPDTFLVKSTFSKYTCHFEVPPGVLIKVGDVLVSQAAEVFVVLEINTRNRNPKGVFVGERLVKETL